MSPGTTTLDQEQWSEVEALAAAGIGPAGILAELAASPTFSPGEAPQARGDSSGSSGGSSGKTKGKKHGGGQGWGGGSGWGDIGKLFPLIKRGDRNAQSSSSSTGLPGQPSQLANPTLSTTGGSSTMPLILLVGAVGIGAYFLLRKKGKKK